MRRFLMRFAIALIAFSAGLAAATIFNGIFGAGPTMPRFESSRPSHPPRRNPCPNRTQILSALPPLPDPTDGNRVVIKLENETIRVVDSRVEKKTRKGS